MRTVVRLKPGVEWREVSDEVVALDLGTSAYLGVNRTGARLWPLVADGTTEGELVDELMARFPIGVDRAQADIGAFVGNLRSLGLLVEEPWTARAAVRMAADPLATVRVARWAWFAARRVEGDLRRDGLDGIARIERSPNVGARHRSAASAVLALSRATCLVRSAVLQRWDADHDRQRALVVGVRRQEGRGIVAHAWLEGDGGGRGFVALHHRPSAFR